jgi:hypothetical protein
MREVLFYFFAHERERSQGWRERTLIFVQFQLLVSEPLQRLHRLLLDLARPFVSVIVEEPLETTSIDLAFCGECEKVLTWTVYHAAACTAIRKRPPLRRWIITYL